MDYRSVGNILKYHQKPVWFTIYITVVSDERCEISQNQGKGKILNEIYFHEYNTGSF
jgi:hypothetical protein